MNERQLRDDLCEYGRRLYGRGFVSANEGNLSVRLGPGRFLCTPTLVSKGFLRADDLAIVDGEANQLAGPKPRTSEIRLHLTIYRERPDVDAVIHTHPPHATAFAITGTPIPNSIHPELEFFLGAVPTVGYVTPGTVEFAESVCGHLDRTCALVLANHGVVTYGDTLERAWFATEILDSYCRLLIAAKALGPVRKLNDDDVRQLIVMKKNFGVADPRENDG